MATHSTGVFIVATMLLFQYYGFLCCSTRLGLKTKSFPFFLSVSGLSCPTLGPCHKYFVDFAHKAFLENIRILGGYSPNFLNIFELKDSCFPGWCAVLWIYKPLPSIEITECLKCMISVLRKMLYLKILPFRVHLIMILESKLKVSELVQ